MRLASSPSASDSAMVSTSEPPVTVALPEALPAMLPASLQQRERRLDLTLALASVLIGTMAAWLFLLVHHQAFGGITPMHARAGAPGRDPALDAAAPVAGVAGLQHCLGVPAGSELRGLPCRLTGLGAAFSCTGLACDGAAVRRAGPTRHRPLSLPSGGTAVPSRDCCLQRTSCSFGAWLSLHSFFGFSYRSGGIDPAGWAVGLAVGQPAGAQARSMAGPALPPPSLHRSLLFIWYQLAAVAHT
jgi:hypothetical protein